MRTRPLAILPAVVLVWMVACASNPKPAVQLSRRPVAEEDAERLLNRAAFGPRPGDAGDVARVQAMGLDRYIDEQLHPDRIPDPAVEERLAAFSALNLSPAVFANSYFRPMIKARQEFTAAQKPSSSGAALPSLRWRLQPIAAMSLPGGGKAVSVLGQAAVTPEELFFQRENQAVFDELQAQKIVRAVFSERQLQEVLTDFWFNHFNVDARKIEDRPVVVEYERDVIRPYVFGRFRDLLGATARSPAMLFYLDNWLSAAPPAMAGLPRRDGRGASAAAAPRPGAPVGRQPPAPPKPAAPTRGLNENYARELMELHTLGVDGGYTQRDVVEVARAFTGWTMRDPHDGSGFFFNDKVHDHGAKRVLGHTLRAGRGIEDGEEVLDLLASSPATARFIATKLVRRFVADVPPPALVDRTARTFLRTGGDLREVVRTILTSPEFYGEGALHAKVKSPFEYVVSALRATSSPVTNVRTYVNAIANLGEPLYQCQPPTGYGDRAEVWLNTGALIARVNFAQSLAGNGPGASKVGLLLGSPEFQRR